MRKTFLFIVIMLGLVVTFLISFINDGTKVIKTNYKITYLDNFSFNSDGPNNRMRRKLSNDNVLKLDDEQDAYVLNEYSFKLLDRQSALNYLESGGVIIVSDKNVTSENLKSKVKTNVAEFDYSKNKHHYGFYLFNNGNENVVINVTLGFLLPKNKQNYNERIVVDEVDNELIAEDIVSYANSRSLISPEMNLRDEESGGGGNNTPTDTTGQVIASAYLQNILYIDGDGEKACSYTIYTQIIDVAKFQDSNGIIHGIYDVCSTFTVDAEEKFRILEYGVRMRNVDTILDASYLNSTTSTTISLGGSIGFQGNIIQGSIEEGYSYTFTPDSQEILNDLPAGEYKYWYSQIVNPIYNASKKIMPSIRIMNDDDEYCTVEYSRVEKLIVEKEVLLGLMAKPYGMLDEYRKELSIGWDSNGFVTQNTHTG